MLCYLAKLDLENQYFDSWNAWGNLSVGRTVCFRSIQYVFCRTLAGFKVYAFELDLYSSVSSKASSVSSCTLSIRNAAELCQHLSVTLVAIYM
jgi:hypothetical protein